MNDSSSHLRSLLSVIIRVMALGCTLCFSGSLSAQTTAPVLYGFHARELPEAYAAQERLFASLRGSGANTVILDLPVTDEGFLDRNTLSNAVYLIHQAGLHVFVIMPTRRDPAAIRDHPEWEDRQYDLAMNSHRGTGLLDLFQTAVLEHLAEQSREIASYAVDGILLGEDFRYGIGDGLGKTAVSIVERSLKVKISAKTLFITVDRKAEPPVIEEYGAGFWTWTEEKRDRLIDAYETIRANARSVNPGIKVGVPVPIVVPVATPSELLARHAFDGSAYRKIDADHYWASIDYRSTKVEQQLSFAESVQLLSRSAYAAISSIKDLDRMTFVLQATFASGTALPLSEIEQATNLVRHAGRTGIVYSITPRAIPSAALTNKMFR